MMPTHSSAAGRPIRILFWIVIITIYVLLRLNPVGIPLDRDEGIFGLIGSAILGGEWPYRDLIDHKPPLVFLIYSFCLWIFPPTAMGIHVFLHIYNFCTLCVLFAFSLRVSGRSAASWTAFAYAVFSINPMVQGFTASTEMFMLLPLCLSLLLAWMGTEDGKPQGIYLALSGVFAAAACWIKQPAFFSVLFTLTIIFYRLCFSRQNEWLFTPLIKALFFWGLGGLALSTIIVAPFAVAGLFEEFFYWSFLHNFYYANQLAWPVQLIMFSDGLVRVVANSPVMLALTCLCILVKSRDSDLPKAYWFLFLLLSALGVSLGYAYAHYYAQLLPAIALLVGLSSASLCRRFSQSWPKLLPATLAGLIVVGQVLPNLGYHLLITPERYSRHFFGINPFPESVEIAKFLNSRTMDDDSIFIFGSEPQILLLAERKSASAFGMIYPLMRRQYIDHQVYQNKTIEQIQTNKPAYIVWVMVPTSLLWDQEADLPILQFLNAYGEKNYRMDGLLLFNHQVQEWQWQPNVNMDTGRVDMATPHIALYKRISE
jgi:hypothetical protein